MYDCFHSGGKVTDPATDFIAVLVPFGIIGCSNFLQILPE